MEISFQTVVLWIIYQFLGLQGFRINSFQHNSRKDRLLVDFTRVPRLNLLLRNRNGYVDTYGREKRFFEFNPVAFKQKAKHIPKEEEFERKLVLFSPYLSSLEHLQLSSEETPVPKFRSTFITRNENPKHLKPYVDHFSGVRSFALHLKHPDKLNALDASAEKDDLSDVDQPAASVSVRAFRRPDEGLMTTNGIKSHERSLRLKHASLDIEPEFERMQGFNDRKHSANAPFLTDHQNFKRLYEPLNNFDKIDTLARDNTRYFKDTSFGTKFGTVSDRSDDSQAFHDSFNAFSFEPINDKALGSVNTQTVKYSPAVDFDFGSFGNVNDENNNGIDIGYGYFKGSGSNFHHGFDELVPNGFQTFEQGFGSFSSDTRGCEDIDSKFCVSNNECSCFGLYKCSNRKCKSTAELTSGTETKNEGVGYWHEEPALHDSWEK